jgi:hypothetical protein
MTPTDQRPEWAEGLAVALLAERMIFYTGRLGPVAGRSAWEAGVVAYQDFGWVKIDTEGNEVEVEADAEFRMNLLAEAIGIDREAENFGEVVAEIELAADTSVSVAEAEAIAEEFRAAGVGGQAADAEVKEAVAKK